MAPGVSARRAAEGSTPCAVPLSPYPRRSSCCRPSRPPGPTWCACPATSPGIQEKAGDRTAVPSGWQSLPGNANCYIAPHAVLENGAPCERDRDCPDKRCRLFPDGDKYCVAEQKTCTLPGNDGVPAGAVIGLHQQCYECSAGMGWKLCGETGKQALQSNQEGVVVRQPSDESAREDWRYRQPVTNQQVNTS